MRIETRRLDQSFVQPGVLRQPLAIKGSVILFERLSTGWQLAKDSIDVVRLDKELLLFPVMSGISCLMVVASFAVPLFYTGALDAVPENADDLSGNVLTYVMLFAFYAVNYFVITFFNSALVACAVIRLKGGDPVLRDGFNAALARLPQIIGWALVSATIGVVLRIIESRSERVGQFVAGLLGMAWAVTTYFVVPVLVIEGVGPITSVKRSVGIMRKTWGESLGANFGIGFLTFLLSLVGALPVIGGIALLGAGHTVPGGILIALGIILVLLASLITSALESIILAALYIYAAEGQQPQGFDSELVRTAFAPR